ncbi:MAG: M23 family metallopeptidase [Acidimicrobiales bacterium]|nr:M23 family metallopeptidase [Acidimicrobiales bacterium]
MRRAAAVLALLIVLGAATPCAAAPGAGLPAGAEPHRAIRRDLPGARRQLADAEAALAATLARRDAATARIAELDVQREGLDEERRQAIDRLRDARATLASRAAAAYVRGPTTALELLVTADSPTELASRAELVRGALDGDRAAVDAYRAARQAVTADLADVVLARDAAEREAAGAAAELPAAERRVGGARLTLLVFEAGGEVAVTGFVFPVAPPYHPFVDDFGAPRMAGTEQAHTHEGTDIGAPGGTALVAAERGVVRPGGGPLGGIELWLDGESGTRYLYAHLSGYAVGIAAGTAVEAGEVVGFVGDTGNAAGQPHLHFEVHPGGGAPVNPYPLLSVADAVGRLPTPVTAG